MKKGAMLLVLVAMMLFGLIMVSFGTGSECSEARAGSVREADELKSPGTYGLYETIQEKQGEVRYE